RDAGPRRGPARDRNPPRRSLQQLLPAVPRPLSLTQLSGPGGGGGGGNGFTPLRHPFRTPALGDRRLLLRRLSVAGCGTALSRPLLERQRCEWTRRQTVELLAVATAAARARRFPWPGQAYNRRARPRSQTFSRLWFGRSSFHYHAGFAPEPDPTWYPTRVVDW